MILSYHDLGEKRRHQVKATVGTDHPASSYGQPLVVLEGGWPLDLITWLVLEYRVVRATKQEKALLNRMGFIP